MKTNVRRVSIDAYRKHIESGKALSQWMRLYQLLLTRPYTRNEAARVLRIPLQSICGRTAELKAAGLVRESLCRVTCPVTGEEAHTLKAVAPEHVNQVDMFEARAA